MTNMSGGRRVETASYIAEMLGQLKKMGEEIDCHFLVYLLDMAQEEAIEARQRELAHPRQ